MSLVIGIVVAMFSGPRWRRGWRRLLVAAFASAALWGFVVLVGASGSVLRAAAMAQLALAGRALGRQGTAGGLLLWGSALLAAWKPAVLSDVSWQLSALGMAGLIWLAPLLAAGLRRIPAMPSMAADAVAATVAAQVFVLPVSATAFGTFSLVAPMANVLGLPLIAPMMLFGALLAVFGLVIPVLAPLFAALTWVPAAALIWLVEWSASLPSAYWRLAAWSPTTELSYLAGLVVLCCFLERYGDRLTAASSAHPSTPATRGRAPVIQGRTPAAAAPLVPSWISGLAFGTIVVLVCVAWAIASPLDALADQPALRLSIPAIDDGGLALVRGADGARLLIDGGPAAGGAAALLGQELRPWDRTIDVVVLTDPAETHALGLIRVLERYRVGLLVDAAGEFPSGAYRELRAVAQRRGVRRLQAEPGTEVAVGKALRVEILGPPAHDPVPPNVDVSGSGLPARRTAEPFALRLRWGDFGVLLPGDLSAARRRALTSGDYALDSTVLLLSERAARDPGEATVLRAADPELVVVQGKPRPRTTPSTDVELTLGTGQDEPAWHRTSADGSLHLELYQDGFRIAEGK